jgi:cyanophycin synthetase
VSRFRTLAAQADLARSVGIRHALRRLELDRRHAAKLAGRRTAVPKEIWADAAAELGATLVELAPDVYQLALDGTSTRIRRQTTPLDDPVAIATAGDKELSTRLLREAGVPVPESIVVDVGDTRSAWLFVAEHARPCVVKPASGSGGEGVTAEVRTRQQLVRALRRVRRSDSRAIVERQHAGDTYRLLLLDGEVVDVLVRTPPHVVGDGRSTIEQLIFAEYERRIDADDAAGLKPLFVDLDCLFTLEQAGLRLDSVPAAGASVAIKTATNFNGPEGTETYRGELAPALLAHARTAASTLGLRLAGVDVITIDATRPLAETGGAVLEVNAVPGLTHHYNVAEPARATRVAVPILRALLQPDL